MKASDPKFKTVAAYIAAASPVKKILLEKLRKAIKQAAPKAEEVISYNMPAFKLNGMLVFYAAFKEHIGFYPTASPIKVFKEALTPYKTSKGAIQFPLDKPLPLSLVKEIVKYRIQENEEKAFMKEQIKKEKSKSKQ
jgi:uncharacterized protein YdhG (YjbR/CyaY superfamily)